MKIRYLTKSQKSKVDKINTLMSDLKKDGVFPYLIVGAGQSGLSFIRCNEEDRWDIEEALLCGGEHYQLYEKIVDHEYQAQDAEYDNPVTVIGA